MTEAEQRLRAHPNHLLITPYPAQNEGFGWHWQQSELGGAVLSNRFRPYSPIVQAVTIQLPKGFTLQDVINVYGEPSHLVAIASPVTDNPPIASPKYAHALLVFVYLPQGMLFRSGSSTITPTTPLLNLMFFEPTIDGYKANYPDDDDLAHTHWKPWEGFLPFTHYCHPQRPGACELQIRDS